MSTVIAAILFSAFTIHPKLKSTARVDKFTAFCFHWTLETRIFFFPIFGTFVGTGCRFIARAYLEPAYIFTKTLWGHGRGPFLPLWTDVQLLHSNNLNSLVHVSRNQDYLKWNATWSILCPQILREVPASEIVLTQCVMSRSGRMLFAGTNSGTLRAMKFPLTVPGEWQEHQVHSGAITKVRLLSKKKKKIPRENVSSK